MDLKTIQSLLVRV